MTTTEWRLTVTTFAGELLGEQRGCGVDRTTAIAELFAAAHEHVVERGHNVLPVYTVSLDGQMVGFVGTGRTPGDLAPDTEGVRAQLDVVESSVRRTLEHADLLWP